MSKASQPPKSNCPSWVQVNGVRLLDTSTVAKWLGVTERTVRSYMARCPSIGVRPYPGASRMVDVAKLAESICPLRFITWPDPTNGQQFSGDFSGVQHLSSYFLEILDPEDVDPKATRFVEWFREQFEYECTGRMGDQIELRPLAMLWLLPCEAAAAIRWLARLSEAVKGSSRDQPGGRTLEGVAQQSIRSWEPALRLIAETPL
ncbi:MAG: hypothetical protein ACF8MJ_10185 [Phycisphaerales bacterium JB050]